MITAKDIITIPVCPEDMALARREAALYGVKGGAGHIPRDDRKQSFANDQVTGMLGEIVGHRYWFGHLEFHHQALAIYRANPHIYQSDGGTDVPGANIDFKASTRKDPTRSLLAYNLWVRETELRDEVVYVQVMVDYTELGAVAHLMGWATGLRLRNGQRMEDIKVRYGLPVAQLNPLPPVQWKIELALPVS